MSDVLFALHTADGAFLLDDDARIVGWNRAAETLLGATEASVLGQRCYEVLVGQDPATDRVLCGPGCPILGAVRSGQPVPAHALRLRSRAATVMVNRSVLLRDLSVGGSGARAVVVFHPVRSSDLPTDPAASDRSSVPQARGDPCLQIHTLGRFDALVDGTSLRSSRYWRPKARLLLAYLLTFRPHPVAREVVAEALWPEAAPLAARQNLRVLVHGLRQALSCVTAGQESSHFLISDQASLRLNPAAPVWTDVDEFRSLLREARVLEAQGRAPAALERYQRALALYQGDYLASEGDADWCLEQREHLREQHLQALERLALLSAGQGAYDQSISAWQQALTLDPTREIAWQGLMRSLWQSGRRTHALRAYQRCRYFLQRDLGVGPLPETHALYLRIRDDATAAAMDTAGLAVVAGGC
ncbi:MAG: PAS domain-containing protein [Chloroflexi bacterium]|nr:PAS domain-containing protein [Chloroflexota bacterium]